MEFLDTLPVLREAYAHGEKDLFFDHCHHSARGSAVVARLIALRLKAILTEN